MIGLRIVVLLAAAAVAGGCSKVITDPGTGGSGGAGGSGTGGGSAADCTATKPCVGGVCTFGPDSCAPDAPGQCISGFSCDGPPGGPVCQCNGEVLEGENAACTLLAMGQPSAPAALCATGTFACGTLACKRNLEVCVVTEGGASTSMSFACAPLASIVGTCTGGVADCSCLDATSLGCPGGTCCTSDADHQETITIQAP